MISPPEYQLFDPQVRLEWLHRRKQGLGASDAAGCLQKSSYTNTLLLYADKTTDLIDDETSEWQRWGLRLERAIAEDLAESQAGEWQVGLAPPFQIRRHREHDWMFYTPDGWVQEGNSKGILQIKIASAWMLSKWEDGPPEEYVIQVQHEMEVEDVDWAILLVLFGSFESRFWRFERRPKFVSLMTEFEWDFWQCVQRREVPPPDETDHTRKALKLLYPQAKRESVPLPGRLIEADIRLEQIKAEEKALKLERQGIENQIEYCLGEHEQGVLPSGDGYTWRNGKNGVRTLRRFERGSTNGDQK